MSENNQWSLLGKKYFAPLFWTQFFGAFNDNLFKNALIILLAFNASILPSNISGSIAINISAGLFILPFFLFSALAGEFADKYEKSKIIRILKIWEIIIISIGIIGFYLENIYWMWLTLFGLGIQSAFFGPLKYSILPQHLSSKELIGGNALIESGTFISILLGTILGGVLMQFPHGWIFVAILSLFVAITGYIVSRHIPLAISSEPNLKIGFNIIKQSLTTISIARSNKTVFLSILGISWFWFFGATLLAQFPLLVKDTLGANESTVTFLLAIFSFGIGTGSLLCDRLSGHKVELGLVPFGAIGLSIFSFDFFLSLHNYSALHHATIIQFLNSHGAFRILIDLIGLSIFGGFFMVPLYAIIQSRSDNNVRSRIIAANNIINAAFMVGSAIFAIILFSLKINVNYLVLSIAIFNTIIAWYIFILIPEFLFRFIAWAGIHTIYKIKYSGIDNIPETGSGLILCNNISFFNQFIIFGIIRRPIKFINHTCLNTPILSNLLNTAGAIPIIKPIELTAEYSYAYDIISKHLNNGELVLISPKLIINQKGINHELIFDISKLSLNNPIVIVSTLLDTIQKTKYSYKFFKKDININLFKELHYHISSPILHNYTNNLLSVSQTEK
jgi:hypothetical protein